MESFPDYCRKWNERYDGDIELLKIIPEAILKGDIIIGYISFMVNIKLFDRKNHWEKMIFYYKLEKRGD